MRGPEQPIETRQAARHGPCFDAAQHKMVHVTHAAGDLEALLYGEFVPEERDLAVMIFAAIRPRFPPCQVCRRWMPGVQQSQNFDLAA
ncbi:hypothetical protein MU516_18100 [Paracoccus sp. YLB-12]|uniref:Uncharacterized protein n=1 Tax=Paracoccus maritimus TaxID=2933292 RepID=A0ABT2KFZ2_9RHOB|nr:hypothetical protein [Paracoccus sp. YLB-12]MCT4334759.1 hypothetical protein [Paracoccus sp. YLB-12]